MFAIVAALMFLPPTQQAKQAAMAKLAQGLMYSDMQTIAPTYGTVNYRLEINETFDIGSTHAVFETTYQALGDEVNIIFSGSGQEVVNAGTPNESTTTYSILPPEAAILEVAKIGFMRNLFASPSKAIGWFQAPPTFPGVLHAVTENKESAGSKTETDNTMALEVPDIADAGVTPFANAVASKEAARKAIAAQGNAAGWEEQRIECKVEKGRAVGTVTIPVAAKGHHFMPTTFDEAAIIQAGSSDSELCHGTLTITWDLSGTPPPDTELVVEPVDYDNWTPKAGKDELTEGNRMQVKAVLQGKGGRALKEEEKASKITFELVNTSHEPGICMNYPGDPSPAPEADMKFAEANNVGLTVLAKGQKLETTKTQLSSATASLSCYDWGANATLKVTAVTKKGIVVGYLEAHPDQTAIRIPKSDKLSKIADKWKSDNDATGLDDKDDSENEPVGDGNKGDGYTLYEEYRGFLENGKHISGSAKRKDVMVCDTIGGRTKDGIALFQRDTELEVHSQFTREEFGHYDKARGDSGKEFERSRILNGNHSGAAPHVVDQHGIVIKGTAENLGYAEAQWNDQPHKEELGTPKDFKWLLITADFPQDQLVSVMVGSVKKVTDEYSRTVAHEMCHACNVPHHGENDKGRWLVKRSIDGTMVLWSGSLN